MRGCNKGSLSKRVFGFLGKPPEDALPFREIDAFSMKNECKRAGEPTSTDTIALVHAGRVLYNTPVLLREEEVGSCAPPL